MSQVSLTVQLEVDDYAVLLSAANEAGLGVSEFAAGIVENYLGENYGPV
jgi:predicted DsbA family dithiol-disulfide isomerase